MQLKTTFLTARGGRGLCKSYLSPENGGIVPYPMTKNFTSIEKQYPFSIEGLRQRCEDVKLYAANGACMLKGNLVRPLQDEPRAGLADKQALTNTLFMDIDKLDMGLHLPDPITRQDLTALADQIIRFFPPALHNATYMLHASSSLGVTSNRLVSLHIEFILRRPISPMKLKDWLTYMNFEIPKFKDNLQLNATYRGLKYPLDRTVADNSKLLFIANPTIDAEFWPKPIADDDRIFLVEKPELTVDTDELITKQPLAEKNRTLRDEAIKQLQTDAGVKVERAKTKGIMKNGTRHELLTNPGRGRLTYAYETDAFVYFNIGEGDSNAYWCPIGDPRFVFNFKDEPIFEMRAFDPDAYEWYVEHFAEQMKGGKEVLCTVFHDEVRDVHYTLKYWPQEDRILHIAETDKGNLENWLLNQGEYRPDPIPEYRVEFRPNVNKQLFVETDDDTQEEATVVNLWKRSEVMRNAISVPEEMREELTYNNATDTLSSLCPAIYHLIFHISGGQQKEFEALVNWVVAGVRYGDKLGTSWILSGVEGTGKGIFYEHVLRPLYGEHATNCYIDTLEDNFTGLFADKQLIVVDEFRLKSGQNAAKLKNKLKTMITEPHMSIRKMRKEAEPMRVYSNFLFFSNDHDVITLSQTDRRFNIAPRQEVPLRNVVPDIAGFVSQVKREVTQFAGFVQAFKYSLSEAMKPLENRSKELMRESSQSSVDLILGAVRNGQLDYLVEQTLSLQPAKNIDISIVQQARSTVVHWLAHANANVTLPITVAEVQTVYQAFQQTMMPQAKFNSMLNKFGWHPKSISINGVPRKGYEIQFYLTTSTPETMADLLIGTSGSARQQFDAKLTRAQGGVH